MMTLSILLSATPLWHWLVIIAAVATVTLIGATIEIVRCRRHLTRSPMPVKIRKRRC